MKADNSPLSSEQALDDYFASLLGLEDIQEELLVEVHADDTEALTEIVAAETEDVNSEAIPAASVADEFEYIDSSDDAQTPLEDDFYTGGGVPLDEPYIAQAQLANTQPLALAELAEIDLLPNLENLEKLFSNLQAQVDCEVDTVEVDAQNDVAVLEQPPISDWQLESAAEQEIQDWDEQIESQVDHQDAIFEASSSVEAKPEPEVKADLESADIEAAVQISSDANGGGDSIKTWQNGERTQSFQVLYFDVNGVTFAVPLDELGGIHKLTTLSQLIGRPDWYLGLQTSRESQLDVVDTAMWAMPDVLTDEEYKQAYDYVVMLGESQWGLACTSLKGTEMLTPDKVRWRETAGKRPWLAGMVKEQMCALVHVSELIGMLDAGLDVKSVQ